MLRQTRSQHGGLAHRTVQRQTRTVNRRQTLELVLRRAWNEDRRLADGLVLREARRERRLRAERRLDWTLLRRCDAARRAADGTSNLVRWALRCWAERRLNWTLRPGNATRWTANCAMNLLR